MPMPLQEEGVPPPLPPSPFQVPILRLVPLSSSEESLRPAWMPPLNGGSAYVEGQSVDTPGVKSVTRGEDGSEFAERFK